MKYCPKHSLHQILGNICHICMVQEEHNFLPPVTSEEWNALNRLEQRSCILPEYGSWEIPDICMQLRTSMTGCSDPLPEKREQTLVCFLEVCLQTWEPSLSKIYERFDNAVKELIEATLAEYKFYTCKQNDNRS